LHAVRTGIVLGTIGDARVEFRVHGLLAWSFGADARRDVKAAAPLGYGAAI
jgi:hypothetical protein